MVVAVGACMVAAEQGVAAPRCKPTCGQTLAVQCMSASACFGSMRIIGWALCRACASLGAPIGAEHVWRQAALQCAHCRSMLTFSRMRQSMMQNSGYLQLATTRMCDASAGTSLHKQGAPTTCLTMPCWGLIPSHIGASSGHLIGLRIALVGSAHTLACLQRIPTWHLSRQTASRQASIVAKRPHQEGVPVLVGPALVA